MVKHFAPRCRSHSFEACLIHSFFQSACNLWRRRYTRFRSLINAFRCDLCFYCGVQWLTTVVVVKDCAQELIWTLRGYVFKYQTSTFIWTKMAVFCPKPLSCFAIYVQNMFIYLQITTNNVRLE